MPTIRSLLATLLAGVGVMVAGPVLAQEQPLDAAIEAWLADDDAAALPALSRAAKAGDPEAMALLSRTEAVTPPGGETPFYRGLGRHERAELLRGPEGLSGTS